MSNNKIILKLLRPGERRGRIWGSWIGLSLGVLLLLLAVIAWLDFNQILSGKESSESMSEYLVIGKKIGNENTGAEGKNLFEDQELKAIEKAPGVEAVDGLTANRFPVSAEMGGSLGFYTEMFLESVDDPFLDSKPEGWQWQPADVTVPVIMSNDFLNLYNYGFALSQGYPQLSQSAIQSLPFVITVAGKEKFRAKIVGFTDRISSVLVPQGFMDAMNEKYGNRSLGKPSRLILKVKDPSEKKFIHYLELNKYTVKQDQLRWSRIRTAVQAIVSSVGIVALVVVGMAVLSFILFVEITVQRAASHIRLMLELGYATSVLSRILYRFFLPWIGSAILLALLLALSAHGALVYWLSLMNLELSPWEGWRLLPVAVIMLLILSLLLIRAVKKILKRV